MTKSTSADSDNQFTARMQTNRALPLAFLAVMISLVVAAFCTSKTLQWSSCDDPSVKACLTSTIEEPSLPPKIIHQYSDDTASHAFIGIAKAHFPDDGQI
ncbi:hypothetical protein PhaeoP18_02283 [Phaeobacter piscinae]|uniref:Uncharacterized protein n=1 Tax=Phaeobacter piscinae TaxID=1580596 RepID=A0AAN1GSN0_9RHOB|nr:hypothetical protein [Phaeobacter piscinae]ATG44229.1 hypothetical protein PhaeoP13_02308 [Phaeobacter piscinae]AUQ73599.1 hypothetical protein PhaeoP71_00716 [Phaeobacter piscinae]AUR36539.1 hypothetical protein PhaeoP18_02283 [Phaeobacter piscinae]